MMATSDAPSQTGSSSALPSPHGGVDPEALPKGWRWVTLGDVVESMKNGVYRPASSYADDGVACLRMYNIAEGRIVWRDVKRMTLSEEEIREYELLPGDLLVNRVNSRELVGKSAAIPPGLERSVFESKNIRLRLRRDVVSPEFVSYRLQSAGSAYFNRNAQQVVGMASISQPQVARFPLPLPPLDEQERLVAEIEKQFSRLDAGVAALRRVQANLKRYRAAVLKAACEGRLIPAESEWEKTTLGEVSTVRAGYGFPERLQGRSAGDYGFFKVGDISEAWRRRERTLTRANHYISKADLAVLRAKLLLPGTVVFAKIGAAIALNRRAILGEPSVVDNNVMGLESGNRIATRYLFYFLCTQKLDELARATTVPSIRKGDVEGIPLGLPPLAEQGRIVAEL